MLHNWPAQQQLLLRCVVLVLRSGSTHALSISCSFAGKTNDSNGLERIVTRHRALIFAQMKTMLDIIESDLFKRHMPTVTYLRMDGATPASQRQDVVNKFNKDPTIGTLVTGMGVNE